MSRLLALLLLLLAADATAHEIRHGHLDLTHPWARATTASAANGATYMAITNEGGEVDRLIGASTPMAAEVQIHSVEDVDGVMQMRQVDGIEIAAGDTVLLEPGGYHMMLIGLTGPLVEGTEFPMTLVFEHGGDVPITVVVEAPGASAHDVEHEHEHETE